MVSRASVAAFALALCTSVQGDVAPRFSGEPVAVVYSERNIPGSPQTRAVAVHPNGLVYVANVEGLVEYDGVTWRMIPGTRGLITHTVAADETGCVWYSGTGHFGRLQPDARGTLVAEPLQGKLPPELRDVGHVLRMLVHRDGAYFVAQGARSCVVHAEASGAVRVIEPPAGERAVALFLREDAVHVVTNANAYRVTSGALTPVPGGPALAASGLHSVWPSRENPGEAWVVGAAGLLRWRGATLEPLTGDVAARLEGDRVSCGAPLGDGTFVLGTERHGLFLVEAASGRVLARYDDDNGLGAVSSNIVAVTPDAEGGVWLARFAGVTRIQLRSPMVRHDGPGGVRGRVQGFAQHRGRLHVATTQGVFVRDAETGRFRALAEAAGDSWVLLSTEDGLIVGGPDLRLIRDDGSVEVIERERLLFRSALRLRRDPDRIVACTGPGLVRVYRRTAGRWAFEAGLPKVRASLYPIFEDDDGRLWATRNRIEIVRLDWRNGVKFDAELETLGARHGLPNPATDPARVAVFLLEGAAEVSSAKGLWRFAAAEDRFVPETRIAGWEQARGARVWPLSDGSLWLAGDAVAIARKTGPGSWRCEPMAFTGVEAIKPLEVFDEPANGTVWIGHLGLASVDLRWRGERAPPPRVKLRSITTTGDELLWGGEGRPQLRPLPPQRNALHISFAAPTFQPDAFGEVRTFYRARLEGAEAAWSPWSAETLRRYPALQPGSFVFHVQARDAAGREGPVETFAFAVEPPWWRTGWFLAVACGLGVTLVAGVTRWQVNRALRRKFALLEAQAALERERLRLARDLHDEIGSGLGRVILFASEAKRQADQPARLVPELERVQASAQELMQHAREIVWAVSPQHDTLESLVERISGYVEQTLGAAGIVCRIDVPPAEGIPAVPLASETRHSLFLAVKEAVHNCVKYSGAKTAELRIAAADGWLTIALCDHGAGFVPAATRRGGHGLLNLAARAEALGGTADIASAPGAGTTVALRVPLPAAK